MPMALGGGTRNRISEPLVDTARFAQLALAAPVKLILVVTERRIQCLEKH
jgi:hypothetical protein